MPLLKLWNALLGRAAGEAAEVEPPVSEPPASPAAAVAARPSVTAKPAASKGFSLFGGNPHAGLCKLVAASGAQTVLEVGVGDGSRAIAVVQTLAKQGITPRYCGIDEFELSGASLGLKDFHRNLRAAGIRAQIFPESVDRGLVKFLHTIGRADLVLLSRPGEWVEEPRIGHLLRRVSHPGSTILVFRNDAWSRLELPGEAMQRAA